MRRVILSIILVSIGLVLLVACTGLAIADKEPISPASPFFPIQRFTEQVRARFIRSDTARAAYYLTIVERRSTDLSKSTGSPAEVEALAALESAIDTAQSAISIAPESDRPVLEDKLKLLANQISTILADLTISPSEASELLSKVEDKINALRDILAGGQLAVAQSSGAPSAGTPLEDPREDRPLDVPQGPRVLMPLIELNFVPDLRLLIPHGILFPSGSQGAIHEFFPLEGVHAQIACESCHTNGTFAGTSKDCTSCHADVKPVVHFTGDCASCHTSVSWKDIHFDHTKAGSTDCKSCHTVDKPANHFQGQCSACHSTSAWKPASFNHAAAGARRTAAPATRPNNPLTTTRDSVPLATIPIIGSR